MALGSGSKVLGELESCAGLRSGLVPMRACSACAGDYEDPDRTVWVTGVGEVEDVEATRAEREEFPAES